MKLADENDKGSCSNKIELSERYYNDLQWIFNSPPLIDKSIFDFSRIKNFNNSSALKTKLLQFITTKNLRMLGPYFEGLWEFALLESEAVTLTEKNLQVIDDKKTLGEFDFIYLDKEKDSYVHLEVSVKYFLGIPQLNQSNFSKNSDLSSWIGPNKNDRLDKKFYKLKDSQSRLSEYDASQKVLEAKGINKVLTEVCLLGYLFYPLNQTMPPPEFTFENHNRGFWCTFSEFSTGNFEDSYWQIIEKPFWLSQIEIAQGRQINHKEFTLNLKMKLKEKNFPILSSQYCFDKKVNQIKFARLFFIVPDNWNDYAS